MRSLHLLPLILAGTVWAETPPSISPNATARLDVIYPNVSIDPPGKLIKQSDTQTKPIIGTSDTILNGTYLFIMVDFDLKGTTPTSPRGQVLHAMLQDYKPSGQLKNTTYILTSSATGPSSYFGPMPPAETPAHPHQYVEFLFEQPVGFKVPASQQAVVNSRLNFNLTAFMRDAGLMQPVRGNWFNVTAGN